MSLAAISSAISVASLFALGMNYYQYTTFDPEYPVTDATNVRIPFNIKLIIKLIIIFFLF